MIPLAALLLLASEPNPDAVRLTRKATVEYNAGEFGQAFLDYQAAYDLESVPELLFDMGQCQRNLHHWERAEFLYKRYLSAKPQARNRAKVDALVAQVEQKAKEEAGTPGASAGAPTATPTNASPEPPAETAESYGLVPPTQPSQPTAAVSKPEPAHGHGIPAAAWITGGVGAACLLGAGGLGLAVLAQPDSQVAEANGGVSHSLTYAQLSTINTEGTVSVGLAIGGAVLLGAATLIAVIAQ